MHVAQRDLSWGIFRKRKCHLGKCFWGKRTRGTLTSTSSCDFDQGLKGIVDNSSSNVVVIVGNNNNNNNNNNNIGNETKEGRLDTFTHFSVFVAGSRKRKIVVVAAVAAAVTVVAANATADVMVAVVIAADVVVVVAAALDF